MISNDWTTEDSAHVSEWSTGDDAIPISEKIVTPEDGFCRILHIVIKSRFPVRNWCIASSLKSVKNKILTILRFKNLLLTDFFFPEKEFIFHLQ